MHDWTMLTSSCCSGVELSVSLTGSAGPFEEAEGRARDPEEEGALLEAEGAEPFLELIWMVTLRTCSMHKGQNKKVKYFVITHAANCAASRC